MAKAKTEKIFPNGKLYGYGAYFIAQVQDELQGEFGGKGARIVKYFANGDCHNLWKILADVGWNLE